MGALYEAGADTVAEIQQIFDQGVVSMREGNLARNYEVQGGKTAMEIMKRARANTVDGRLVAVVDDDILSGIYTGTWDKATTEQQKSRKNGFVEIQGWYCSKRHKK